MRSVLAIDSGGTKCDALVVGEDGTAIGWGHCNVSHPESGRGVSGSGRSRETVLRAVTLALDGCDCDELHIANGERLKGEACLSRFASVVGHPVWEADGPMALAGVETGVVALAGTGSFVFARTRDGRTCHLDGLGPHLGDYGSGYQIGLMALRATARARWHARHETSLAEPVIQACREHLGDRFHGLVAYSLSNPDRAEIASLARRVDGEAERGDAVAQRILRDAAASLAETLYDVVERLGIHHEEYALIGTGGVAQRSRLFWEHFCERAHEFAPALTPVRSPLPPVVGVALSVLGQMGVSLSPELRRTLYRTAQELACLG